LPEKLNPAKLKLTLRFHGVRQVVVFGRASALRNEEAAACVVASPGISVRRTWNSAVLIERWQVPKPDFIVDAIPVNERGKLAGAILPTLCGN
jgi:acyl-coenzyme A synthetase/AMP-(fatty) acid ligase